VTVAVIEIGTERNNEKFEKFGEPSRKCNADGASCHNSFVIALEH
jgi:hypothetical protein